jgi:hypothetical protein
MNGLWSWRRGWTLGFATLGAAAVLVLSQASAQDPDDALQAATSSEATYRRIFVPLDRPQDWPTDGQQYLPLNRAEFERLIQLANERRQLATPGEAQIESSVHRVKLGEDGVLEGESMFKVRLLSSSPRLLKLSPSSSAVTRATWKDPRGEKEGALLGAWSSAQERDASFGVLATRSGELVVDWSAAPDRRSPVEFEYALRLPLAASREMSLDLPAIYSASMTPATPAEIDDVADAPRKRWLYKLAPSAEHRLQIHLSASSQGSGPSQPLAAVTEAYGLTPGGLDYQAEFRIQQREAVGELRVEVPKTLQVIDVRVDRSPVPWHLADDDSTRLIIPLRASASLVTVTIKGMAAVVLDQPWELPRARPLSIFWTEGMSTLSVDPAMELQSIVPRGASLLNVVGAGSPVAAGEAYRLQARSSEASAEIVVSERTPQEKGSNAIAAEFAEQEILGRARAKVWAAHGSILQISAIIDPSWTVEAVETTPAADLAAWHVAEEGAQRRLYLQLRNSPTELKPLQVTIAARKPLQTAAHTARLRELDWIRFSGDVTTNYFLLRDRRGNEVSPGRSAVDAVVSPDSLSSADKALLDVSSSDLLLAASKLHPDSTFRIERAVPRFQGEAWMVLTKSGSAFEYRAELSCRPVSGAVQELTVLAARPLPVEARWEIVGDGEEPIVEPVPNAPRAALSDAEGTPSSVEYRVRLAQPRNKPFRLRATWRGMSSKAEAINSLTLRGAENWQSWGILRGDPDRIRIDPNGCAPAAASGDAFEFDDSLAVLGCFRLSDDPSTPTAAAPAMTAMDESPQGKSSEVLCWLCELRTVQFADGRQLHQLAYNLENSGVPQIELAFPSNVEISGVQVDGVAAALEASRADSNRLGVRLPAGRRFVTVGVDFRAGRPPLGFSSEVTPPMPTTSFSVARGRWTVFSPPQYAAGAAAFGEDRGWLRRLFGPLARGPGATPANSGLINTIHAAVATTSPAEHEGAADSGDTLTSPPGWSSTSADFVAEPASVRLRRIDKQAAAWYLTWLLSAVISARWWARKRRHVAVLGALAALGSLSLPLDWAGTPQAIFLGLVTGLVVRQWILGPKKLEAASMGPRATAVGALFLVGMSASVHGSDMTATPPGVLFPIAADGKSAGDDVYVPTRMLEKLLSLSQSGGHDGASSVLLAANYDVDLQRDAASGEIVCRACTLRFRWQTFRVGARLELPLEQSDAQWQASEHKLDGLPASLSWSAGGHGCSLVAGQPGIHQLQLKLVPKPRLERGQYEMRLHVPRLPGAEVLVRHPVGLDVRLASAVVAASGSNLPQTSARLSDIGVLELGWPARPRDSQEDLIVEQLSWLQVDSASARLEVRLQLSGEAASLDALELATSPQLKLLPLPEGSFLEEVPSGGASPGTVRLQFQQQPRLPVTMSLGFQIQRAASVGRMDFPSVRVLGAETSRHDFAASVDRRLRARDELVAGLTPIPIEEIENRWGPLSPPTSMHYAVGSAEPLWSMQIEPSPPQQATRETLELLCTADDVETTYRAAMTDVDGEVIQYRLEVPPAMTVEDVIVSKESDKSRMPIRWSRPQSDLLTIFLGRPLDEPHTLQVAGRIPYSDERRLTLPRIGLEAAGTAPLSVTLRRTSDVLVQGPDAPSQPLPFASKPESDVAGLLVGHYSIDRGDGTGPQWQVADNDVEFSAESVISLRSGVADPTAEYVLRGRVEQGVVDHIRLASSKNWREPLSADSGVATVREAPGDDDRQIIDAQLAQPVSAGNEFTLRLTGRLSLEADQRLRFPAVRLVNVRSQRTFLLLPEDARNQTADWTLRGLRRTRLPETLSRALGKSAPPRAYRVERERFLAEQRVFPDAMRRGAVRLSENFITIDSQGQWAATSEIIVQPGGAAVFDVQLPAGAQFIYAAVDGRKVGRPIVKDGLWQTPAGPRYLPRVISIAYRGSSETRRQWRVEPPQVLVSGRRLRAGRALWQVECNFPLEQSSAGTGNAISQSEFLEAARRETLRAVLDASPLALQLPQWESHQWFAPWLDRLDKSVVTVSSADKTQEAAWAALGERIEDAGDRPARERGRNFATSPVAFREGATWYESEENGALNLTRASHDGAYSRWLAALGIAAAWGAAWRYPAKAQQLLAVSRRSPYAVGLLVGIFWLLALRPSVLGLGIVVISLAAFYRSHANPRRRESPPSFDHEGSTATTAIL